MDAPYIPDDLDSLKYLSEARRGQVLLGVLSGRFTVDRERGAIAASLSLDDQTIFEIARPSDTHLKEQITWLRNYADLRDDRIAEITVQTSDILSFFGSIGFLNTSRRKYSLELLSLVQALAVQLEMQIKHYCWSPRPIDFAQEVQPIIQTPDHSTYPSGHATEAYALATVLHRLQTKQSAQDGIQGSAMPFRLAHRIAVNRTVAGVHFPVDSAAGATLGCMIGEAVHAIAIGDMPARMKFDKPDKVLGKNGDFTQTWLKETFKPDTAKKRANENMLISKFWEAAAKEWMAIQGAEGG